MKHLRKLWCADGRENLEPFELVGKGDPPWWAGDA